MNYSDIAYAKLNLDFDHRLFALEYDKLIYPYTHPITNSKYTWENTRKLNQAWNMVDPDIYDKCSVSIDYKNVEHKELPQWQMIQLMCLEPNESDSDMIKEQIQFGGTFARNMTLHRDWKIKPEFEKLKIVEFIKKLPLKKMSSIHCVSLEPGTFASIHRDDRWFAGAGKPNTVAKNGVIEQGFVIITLNISDGGVPLYWSFDGKYAEHAYHANDPVYITSDYFLHGVPVCASRRRQIRVTGIPTDDLAGLIAEYSKILIPQDMEYATKENWYPG
jgi:hypothetical protein